MTFLRALHCRWSTSLAQSWFRKFRRTEEVSKLGVVDQFICLCTFEILQLLWIAGNGFRKGFFPKANHMIAFCLWPSGFHLFWSCHRTLFIGMWHVWFTWFHFNNHFFFSPCAFYLTRISVKGPKPVSPLFFAIKVFYLTICWYLLKILANTTGSPNMKFLKISTQNLVREICK